MAFCTNCGASLNSEFCTQCGQRSGQTASAAAAVASSESSPTSTNKTNPLVWILVVVFGGMLLIAVIAFSSGMFAINAAKNFSVDVSESEGEDGEKNIVIRNEKTGQTVTINKSEPFKLQDSVKKSEPVKKDESIKLEKHIPNWAIPYPGAEVDRLDNITLKKEEGEVGYIVFLTNDSPDAIASFYEDAFKKKGWRILNKAASKRGIAIVAIDEANKKKYSVYSSKERKNRTSVAFTVEFEK